MASKKYKILSSRWQHINSCTYYSMVFPGYCLAHCPVASLNIETKDCRATLTVYEHVRSQKCMDTTHRQQTSSQWNPRVCIGTHVPNFFPSILWRKSSHLNRANCDVLTLRDSQRSFRKASVFGNTDGFLNNLTWEASALYRLTLSSSIWTGKLGVSWTMSVAPLSTWISSSEVSSSEIISTFFAFELDAIGGLWSSFRLALPLGPCSLWRLVATKTISEGALYHWDRVHITTYHPCEHNLRIAYPWSTSMSNCTICIVQCSVFIFESHLDIALRGSKRTSITRNEVSSGAALSFSHLWQIGFSRYLKWVPQSWHVVPMNPVWN